MLGRSITRGGDVPTLAFPAVSHASIAVFDCPNWYSLTALLGAPSREWQAAEWTSHLNLRGMHANGSAMKTVGDLYHIISPRLVLIRDDPYAVLLTSR